MTTTPRKSARDPTLLDPHVFWHEPEFKRATPSQQAQRWAHSQHKQGVEKMQTGCVCHWRGTPTLVPLSPCPGTRGGHARRTRARVPADMEHGRIPRAHSPAVSLHSKLMTLIRWKPELHSSPPKYIKVRSPSEYLKFCNTHTYTLGRTKGETPVFKHSYTKPFAYHQQMSSDTEQHSRAS